MKKRILLTLSVLLTGAFFTACHSHEWKDATCTEPKTCTVCEKTEGEPTGHKWEDATCTEPSTCSVCGETEGTALGHKWSDATCTEAKVCSVCNETEGEALGHKWIEATCLEPKTCSVCGETEGEKADHTPGKWEISFEAEFGRTGMKEKKCTVCGEVLKKKKYHVSDEEIREAIGDESYALYKKYVKDEKDFEYFSEESSLLTPDSCVNGVQFYEKDGTEYSYIFTGNGEQIEAYYVLMRLTGYSLGESVVENDEQTIVAFPIYQRYGLEIGTLWVGLLDEGLLVEIDLDRD